MNSIYTDVTPCFVQTQQGVSIKYQEKFLYSKYNPAKNIESIIEKLEVLSGTIFLCNSPVLNYGINSLLNKLSNDCLIILCEIDNNLRNNINEYYRKDYISNNRVIYPSIDELYDLPVLINKKNYKFSDNKEIFSGYYKRVIRIDFSAGTQFNQDFYNQLEIQSINAIKTFWVNRVTLTKFGRKYSHNLFRNLSALPYTTPIQIFFNSITKPIIICGAGESLTKGINDFKDNKDSYFILAVDTAANFLIKNNIIPDGIFIEEAQNIILKSFFDVNNYNECHIFAGISSLPNLTHYIKDLKKLSYFFTEYSSNDFLSSIQQESFFPPKNPPFGSVGLTTVYYALKFRQNDEIPVYIYGLDFSYTAGITHVRNSISHKERLIHNSRLQKIANYNASYLNTTKLNDSLFTTITLNNYANLFKQYFNNIIKLYDSRDFGISLNLPSCKPKPFHSQINKLYNNNYSYSKKDIKTFIYEELTALKLLKNILTNNCPEFEKKSSEKINKILTDLLYKREYLYLHFIDGYQLNLKIDFLKRIRTEIDYYLKDFELILQSLA